MLDPNLTRPRISVCMAAYNGSLYIAEQILSILPELGDGDELIVIDDKSTDDTKSVVMSIADPRIRLIESSANQGYVRTFEQAIGLASGEIIFLSDQDDVWVPGRVALMLRELETHALTVSNFGSFGGALTRVQSKRLRAEDGNHRLRNIFWMWIGTRPYYGCCMAFRAELREQLLPFPEYLTETHDQWIGYVGNVNRSVSHIAEDTINRRVHDSNSSAPGNRSLAVIVKARIMTGRAIFEAFRRRRVSR